ncbi:MAG: McrC family protein, partial [Psychrobacter sp.]|nr:McrC family protein [Psychrobacter sp.]
MINNSFSHKLIANNIDSANVNAFDVNTITVFEHQRLTAHDFLQVSDFHWLMAQEFAVFSIKRRQGQWQLKVGHYIGVILLPSGMTLEILPKLAAKTSSDQVAQQSYLSQNTSHRH